MTERPRAIIFDWDNTLVDTWETIHEALVATLRRMGHQPWTLAETKSRVARSLRHSFPALFGARWEEARGIYLESYAAIHLERLAALPGAATMLATLHDAGYYLAVVSNKTGASLRTEAAHIGWDGYFRRLVGAGDARADKPDPACFAFALDGSGIVPGRSVWYVGDTALDMESAHRAGLTGVLLGKPHSPPAELAKFPPDLRFPGCDAFVRHLGAM
ncbi:MAG: HAD family hydrolase [Alphaproteobacteria bacterium]|nr:HAD family hydrolase [Alphaproteobacteria bacterium]